MRHAAEAAERFFYQHFGGVQKGGDNTRIAENPAGLQCESYRVYDKIPNRKNFRNARSQKPYDLVLFLCHRHNMLVEYRYITFFSCRRYEMYIFSHFT
jgi:hypothetical protein